MADLEDNKRIVREFMELAINGTEIRAAVARYVDPGYLQHSPSTPPGVDGLVERFEQDFKPNSGAQLQIARMIAEGDLVAVHSLVRLSAEDRGTAVADIFRVKNGKLVEHWDVAEPVPDEAPHDNPLV